MSNFPLKSSTCSFYASAPKGVESLLIDELKQLGALEVKQSKIGATFQGDLQTAYRVCLWSRVANRVLVPIHHFPAPSPDALYQGILQISWEDHFDSDSTIAVDFHSVRSEISHTHFGALKVKDGIADYFRERTGSRPTVQLENPDIRINLYLQDNDATVSIDLSGGSLHRRGYRKDGALAPLKENLAAAILIKAGWPQIAKGGGNLIDPMCGSGTLIIEAALIAGDSAPGLLREHFGFLKWKPFESELWESLIDEAEQRENEGFAKLPQLVGYDSDRSAIKSAFSNLERAGLTGMVHFEKREIANCSPLSKMEKNRGMLIANPPYGERIGKIDELRPLYSGLGEQLKKHFVGWQAAIFTGNPHLGKAMGLRAIKKSTLYNGTIRCDLLCFDVTPQWFVEKEHHSFQTTADVPTTPHVAPEAEPFVNRLKKNLKKLKPWLKQRNITAFRAYDQDLPEFAVAVDIYDQWVHVQEYEAPKSVSFKDAHFRLGLIMQALPVVLEIAPEKIFLKVRKRQKGALQYAKRATEQVFHEVQEHDCRFFINFTDYLDTGLFLDHRQTRLMVHDLAKGKRFLNLFAYTGTATVYAAKGGAKKTTTVDLSRIYLGWAKRNMALNGFDSQKHQFIESDCIEWVQREKNKYDLIFLDPPTFSNSKKIQNTFDVQRDHVSLIQSVMSLLEPGGILIFSNNFRKFKMGHKQLSNFHIEDWTAKTIPKDYVRNSKIHNCWKITY